MIVADCNLLAYLLLAGPRTSMAEAVFAREPHWCAPLLWRSEFRNILATQMRVNRLPLADALVKMTEAEAVLAGREPSVISDEVLEECARSGVSAYDAEYIVVAGNLALPLVTSDEKLQRAARGIACSPEAFLSAP
jgi:predicted nucleic acid-binding protein